MKKSVLFLFGLLFSFSLFAQSILSPKVVENLTNAVYEVVVDKFEDGNIVYEKELPLDRIPFSIRNDKFTSIGTAFLMEDGKFYSAAHVLNISEKSPFEVYYLRDKNGKTYKIKNIEKFSTHRDFVVFSVEGIDVKKATKLKIAPEQEFNTEVFSVGNALGEGIVIRDGLYTSQTHEEFNGDFKWLRFSAAASPGNSGGPLVNSDGKVLGIITMKSENENLNFALPFAETKNVPDQKGIFFMPAYYTMPNIQSERFFHIYDSTVKLPKTISEIQTEISEYIVKETKLLIKEIEKSYGPFGSKGFVKEDPYIGFMDSSYRVSFPHVACVQQNGEWGLFTQNDLKTITLENEGHVKLGNIFGYVTAFIKKPENVTVEELIDSPRKYCDYIIKGLDVSRPIAGERILITSLGEPVLKESFIDNLSRKWFVNYYEIPFLGALFMTVALPVPNGLVVYCVVDTSSQIQLGHKFDVKFIADYVFPPYTGTTKEWNEFLSIPEEKNPKYEIHNTVSIGKNDSEISVNCDNLSIVIPEKFNSEEKLLTSLFLGYEENENKLSLKPFGFNTFKVGNSDEYFSVFMKKIVKPLENAPKNDKEVWDNINNEKGNYSGKVFSEDGYKYIYKTMKKDDEVYLYSFSQSDTISNREFKKNVNQLEKSVLIK